MSKLEDELQYIIRDKETKELYTREVFLNVGGAKNSYKHSEDRRVWMSGKSGKRFDDQDKYEIIKVRLVAVDE